MQPSMLVCLYLVVVEVLLRCSLSKEKIRRRCGREAHIYANSTKIIRTFYFSLSLMKKCVGMKSTITKKSVHRRERLSMFRQLDKKCCALHCPNFFLQQGPKDLQSSSLSRLKKTPLSSCASNNDVYNTEEIENLVLKF